MPDMDRVATLSKIAGFLLVISGITHIAQLFIYARERHVIGAAMFGLIYLAIGTGILTKRNIILYGLGTVLPGIGGVLGVYRFMNLHANPFSVFHVGIDLVVVPVCLYLLVTRSRNS